MPWGWGKKAPAPGAESPAALPSEAPVPAGTDPLSDAPLPGTVRFRIDGVYTITGIGCVVAGEVEQGTLRPPCPMNLVPLSLREGAPESVLVATAEAHHKLVAQVEPGTKAGLTLRGITGAQLWVGARSTEWPVEKGDRLVSP